MNLVNEEDTWNKLGNTVINVSVDDFVDLESELLGDFGLLGSINLAH